MPDSFHNGLYEVTAYYWYGVIDYDAGEVTTYDDWKTVQFEIDNLLINNVTVGTGGADYILWDPDSMTQPPAIQLNLTDTQNGTAWVQARIYTSDQTWVKTVVTSCPRPGQTTVQWDGKDSEGNVMPKGVYLFHLEVAGEGLPGSDVYASDKYRSGYWTWDWLQIVDTRFDTPPGYEQVPPPPKDYQRVWYKLVDSRKASQAFVELFDPDLNKIASAQGGKEVNGDANGSVWNYADVPFTAITTGGEYVLLVSAKDDDGQWDKAHRQRWALQHNVKNYQFPVINIANTKGFAGGTAFTRAKEAWDRQKAIKGEWRDNQGKVYQTSQYQQSPQSRCVMSNITGQEFLKQLATKWKTQNGKTVFDTDTNTIFFIFGHGPGDKNPDLNVLHGKIIFTAKGLWYGGHAVALDANDTALTAAIQRQYSQYTISYLSSLNKGAADYCRLVVLVGCNIVNEGSKDLINDIVDRLGADAGISVGVRETNAVVASTFCIYFWAELSGYDDKQQKYIKPLVTIRQAADSAEEKTKGEFRLASGYSPEAEQDFKVKKKGLEWLENQKRVNGLDRTLSPPWWGTKNF